MTASLDMLPEARRVGATAGGEYAGPCPWCGGTDRFRAWPDHPAGKARWWCRRCGRHGDAIDLLYERHGLTFREAVAVAGQPVADRPRPAPRPPQETPLRPPCPAWQARAEEVAVGAERTLWRPEGARALAYLHGRGFSDDTIHGARLGYMAQDRREAPNVWGGDREVWDSRWMRRLAAAPVVLVAYDGDEAGERAAAWWLGRLPRARRLVPEGDPAGMLEAGADLRAWVEEAMP